MTFRQYSVATIVLFVMVCCATMSLAAPPQASNAGGGSYPVMSPAAEGRARQVFELWENGQTGALFATFAEALKKNSGGEAKFAAYSKQLRDKMGKETKMLDENMTPGMLAPQTEYGRLSQYSKANIKVITRIVLDEHGVVQAFMVGPEPSLPEGRYAGYQDTAKLRLPFNGDWFVLQGGHSVFDNAYMQSEEGRFSIDFAKLKNGRPLSGDPSKNESFYCFGEPILAPADGTVVRVENGYVDNPPGTRTQDSPQGNLVIISHGNREFSVVDHLKQNSITVKKGDTVKQGDTIGACGNSGSSPVPHVHFQLRNSVALPPPEPLPAQFHDYVADGKLVAVGEPIKGQTVSNAPTTGNSKPAAEPPKTEPVKK